MSERAGDAMGHAKAAVGHIAGHARLIRVDETDQATAHVKEVAGHVIDRAKDPFWKAT